MWAQQTSGQGSLQTYHFSAPPSTGSSTSWPESLGYDDADIGCISTWDNSYLASPLFLATLGAQEPGVVEHLVLQCECWPWPGDLPWLTDLGRSQGLWPCLKAHSF